MIMSNKVYLGDGVYANTDGYHVTITTENGISTTNTIHLDPEVMAALVSYQESLKSKKR
jgi:hypothetical protein